LNIEPKDNAHKSTIPGSDQVGYANVYPPQGDMDVLAQTERFRRVSPFIVYIILGVTIFVYLLQMLTQNVLGFDLPAALGVKANDLIIQGQIWRLFTPMFLHGSILHLGFNMYALYVIGSGLERFYGHWRFLTLYLLAGFCGNVLSFLFTTAPSLGSSTAIFGLLGAEGVFLYQNQKLLGRMAQRSLVNLVMIAVINLLIGLSPAIDNWGHIGGLIGGTLFAWFAGPLFRVEGIFPNRYVVDAHSSEDVIRAVIGVGALFFALAATGYFLRL
jgi:rhomboid protease GluP